MPADKKIKLHVPKLKLKKPSNKIAAYENTENLNSCVVTVAIDKKSKHQSLWLDKRY
jgi:hypothetical protein